MVVGFRESILMKIRIINGPNLNLLGTRQPEIYGGQTFEEYFILLQEKYPSIEMTYIQSNVEGELITELQKANTEVDGIILNAAAYTHTSVGIGDAVAGIDTPVVEVHISNTFGREAFRHQSYISKYAKGVILGFGLESYNLALMSFNS